jgi:hypothetical protein
VVIVFVVALRQSAPAAAAPTQAPSTVVTPSPAPAVGDIIPPFEAEALDGTLKHVGFPAGSRTVLLFFLSGCPTCHKMIPEWNRAFERRPKGVEVVGILLDKEPPGFFMATPIAFPVLRSPAPDFARKLKVNKVPATLRVVAGGKLEDTGTGLLDPIRLGEIFRP